MRHIFSILFLMALSNCLLFASSDHITDKPNPDDEKKYSSAEAGMFQETTAAAPLFFVSSNTQPTIGVFDVTDISNITMSSFSSEAADADGIYYNRTTDVLYQLNRTDNVINAYTDVCTTPTLMASSTSGFRNGREITVVGNKLVVAQDATANNGNRNKLIVYNLFSSNAVSFDKAFNVGINLWGIQATGNTLFAVVDNSNQLAVFNDFFSKPAGNLTPDALIAVEGLVRTHGITYDAETDMMLLTDVGDAGSATDGALVMIPNWTTASADGVISMAEQGRASGARSQLGNPVDVALDQDRRRVYVAERANEGGKVLVFKLPILTGGIAPAYSKLFPGASAIYFSDTDDMTDNCELSVDGGTVSLANGTTETTIVVDGNADMISFNTDTDPILDDADFTYVVTDADGIILGIPPGNTVDFDPAGIGACLVYGLSYTGELRVSVGDNLLEEGTMISDECFELSSNRITVNRVMDQDVLGEVFFSSNTQPSIATIDILEDGSLITGSITSVAADADGIYYDRANDVLYQLNRTDNVINLYGDVSSSPMLIATSSSDFINGREIAVSGNKLVVAQDANDANGQQNRLVVYNITPTSITFETAYDVSINLWGIHATGDVLYAIVDNSSDLAVFNSFFSLPMGSSMTPDAIITIDGMVRTHGITYDPASDMMLLTDVGDAASATDGALVMIRDFTMASADNMISMAEQGRASGGASQLGNPVDVAMDLVNRRIYVAERASGGGKILVFKMPILTGGIAPFYVQPFAGASAVYLSPVVDEEMLVEENEREVENLLNSTLANPNSIGAQAELALGIEAPLVIEKVYPVPAIDQLNVSLSSVVEQEVTIGIFNVAGKLITQKRLNVLAGDNLTTFDLADWAGGMYFIRIPSMQITTKFVKAGKR